MRTIERRVVAQRVEVREVAGQKMPTIAGYAAVFNTETNIGDFFREVIAPGAFRSAIGSAADVRVLFNHDENIVLGRTTNGTLRLSEDERGLRYEFDPNPDDPDAQRVVAKIQRGDVTQSSFGFRVKAEEWTKPASRTELPLRTITEVELLRDVSPVAFPAYEDTSVSAEARTAAAAQAAEPEPDPAPDHSVMRARLDLLELEA